jgi:PBSX family phage terminase large subunit
MLQKTTAQVKISRLRKRVRIVRGGTSSSKTFSIIPLLIDYAVKNPKVEISIVSETIPHLRRGAIRDFLKIMEMVGMFDPLKWNKSSWTYSFSNDSYIEFFSADQPQKLRGARRDVLFVNECNNIDWESYYQMAIRTRKFIYLDYNPVAEFWVDSELVNDADAEMIVLTYKDNEALDKSIVNEIEKARDRAETSNYWANWWRVYGLVRLETYKELFSAIGKPLTKYQRMRGWLVVVWISGIQTIPRPSLPFMSTMVNESLMRSHTARECLIRTLQGHYPPMFPFMRIVPNQNQLMRYGGME